MSMLDRLSSSWSLFIGRAELDEAQELDDGTSKSSPCRAPGIQAPLIGALKPDLCPSSNCDKLRLECAVWKPVYS